MARQRMIKPEFWSDAKVARLSLRARLLFIGLWNFADDGGVHPDDPAELRLRIFPGDLDATDEEMDRCLGELIDTNLVSRFNATCGPYLYVRNWLRHQQIRKPHLRYPQVAHTEQAQYGTSTAPVQHQYSTGTAPVRPESESESESETEVRDVVLTVSTGRTGNAQRKATPKTKSQESYSRGSPPLPGMPTVAGFVDSQGRPTPRAAFEQLRYGVRRLGRRHAHNALAPIVADYVRREHGSASKFCDMSDNDLERARAAFEAGYESYLATGLDPPAPTAAVVA